MNSINILSAKVIGRLQRPGATRSSTTWERPSNNDERSPLRRSWSFEQKSLRQDDEEQEKVEGNNQDSIPSQESESVAEKEAPSPNVSEDADENAPLLQSVETDPLDTEQDSKAVGKSRLAISGVADILVQSLKWVFTNLAAPVVYLFNCLYDKDGNIFFMRPFVSARKIAQTVSSEDLEKLVPRSSKSKTLEKSPTDNELEEDGNKRRRSTRLKNNDNSVRRPPEIPSKVSRKDAEEAIAAELKSPTSPSNTSRLAKYQSIAPIPRPLVPRRQPSYTNLSKFIPPLAHQKTLILDLDETLIHSLAKGGRMSNGHMVEVKLSSVASYNGQTLGPQHPILYYVHKRPHCDEFLRKISKWYNLVIFTASVQEYADPVIDWLEMERKYFTARYYRQHCTFRAGAYIKDLSHIEPDLSKVMILDNSPLSYIFHEDNAIPIEGWITDPTDKELLHLLPTLEALQYVTDVRALLSLRRRDANNPVT